MSLTSSPITPPRDFSPSADFQIRFNSTLLAREDLDNEWFGITELSLLFFKQFFKVVAKRKARLPNPIITEVG